MGEEEKMKGSRDGPVQLDTILIEEVGQFGWYQLRSLMLAACVASFSAFVSSEYVFTTSRIPTRCLIPECDGESPDFSPSWIANAIPSAGDNGFDNCQRFANANSSERADRCPPWLFNRDAVEDCEEYVYENTDSVAYDFNLACDEWRRSLLGTIGTLGTLTALPLTGFVSDRWGRRTALAVTALNTAWMGVLRYWAGTYVGFMMSRFFEAMFGSGTYSCAYILVMELVGPKYRVPAGATISTFFSVGQVLLGLIAWGLPNWRHLTLAIYAPQLLTVFYFWIVAESIRWLMSKGRYEESELILKNMAKVNKTHISDMSLEALRESAEDEKVRLEAKKLENKKEPWLIVLVLRSKPILIRCLVSPVWWLSSTFIYFGMSLNSVNMSGNRYVNFVAVSCMEIPGYWTAVYLLSRVGRKPVLIGAFWGGAACQLAFIFLPKDIYWLSLLVFLIAKFCSAMVATTVYIYTAELYPTQYRHSLFAFSSMIGRIGSITAPLTPALGETVWVHLPFVLFGLLAFTSGCLAFIPPETLGTTLPNTIEEAELLGKKKTKEKKVVA